MEDRDILALFWARDEKAISECEKKFGAECRRIVLRILSSPEDAEECVSDTWLRAWNAIPPACPEHLSAFLSKIARNLALNRLRLRTADKRGGGEADRCLDELEDILPDAESSLDGVLLRDEHLPGRDDGGSAAARIIQREAAGQCPSGCSDIGGLLSPCVWGEWAGKLIHSPRKPTDWEKSTIKGPSITEFSG